MNRRSLRSVLLVVPVLIGTPLAAPAAARGSVVLEAAASAPTADRLAAARAFLATLDEAELDRASAPVNAPDRGRWSYLPEKRVGLRLEELDEAQRAAWRRFLATALTAEGVARIDRIRATEPVEDRGGGVFTGPDVFAIRFHGLTGDPAPTPRGWAWRLEGHHLHIGETIVDGEIVSATPLMLGSVRRVDDLGEVFEFEDAAAANLLAGVPDAARGEAWVEGPVPGDLRTAMLAPDAWRLDGGLSLDAAGPAGRAIADAIVSRCLAMQSTEAIGGLWKRWAAVPDDEVRFAWVGAVDRTKPHQWRLVSPVLIVEFSHSGGNSNHGHLSVRTPNGEFPASPDAWSDAP